MKPARLLLLLLASSSLALAADPGQLAAAKALFDQRKLPEARSAFEKLAAADPRDAEITFYLGELARRRGELAQAIELLGQASAAAPNVGRYSHALGDAAGEAAQKANVFSQLGLAKKSRLAYEKAVELEPANVPYRRSLLVFYRQAPGFVGGGMDKAYAQAEAIRQLDPAAGRIETAGLYVAEKKYPEAFALYDAALQDSPDDYILLYQFGRLAAIAGQQLDRGSAALEKCLTLAPPPNSPGHAAAHTRLGNLWEKKGDKAAARAAYEAALKLEPAFKPALDSLKALK
ncbi:MAG: tetratricopeptide repeat protein [Opitutae bacterium]|nr:tetratricopeptide repeat protein [Opitutae bacterium]